MGIILDWLTSFEYYKEPEGQDPVGKVMGFVKYGFITGGAIALLDCSLLSKCQTLPQILNTSAFWILPLTGMCVTFSSVVYISNSLRKKDDKYNYVLGAIASSYVFHCWCKNIVVSMGTGGFFILYAMLKKDAVFYNRPQICEIDEFENRWTAPWRNLEKRNYLSPPKYLHDKTSHYIHF